MFKNNEDALVYLRKCGKIVIPSKFTYWCHSGQVKSNSAATKNPKFDKLWGEIPSDNFTVRHELSLLSKRQRLQYVARDQNFGSAPTSYAEVEGQEGFQIKVMIPRLQLSNQEFSQLGKDDGYKRKLAFEDRGLGDGRHPKLSNKTRVFIFGFMNEDEMSRKQIKTVIGVREEDLISYANEVKREIAEKAKTGIVDNSKYSMPKSREEIVEEKELFVMGDNEYNEFIGIANKTKAEHKISDENRQKPYNLETLKEIIDKEYSSWQMTDDAVKDRFKTIDQARQDRFCQNPTVGGVYGVSAKDGNVSVDRCGTSSDQKRLLISMQQKTQELALSIERQIESKYGNYLMYATNDYCDLEMIDKLLPKVEERLHDLVAYEKHIGRFSTTTVECKTVKKRGVMGLFGAKDTQYSQRRLTDEELAIKKQSDIIKLNIALAEGEIDKVEYAKLCESVERLYEGEIQRKKVEKVSMEEIDEMKLEFQPKKFALEISNVQKNQLIKQQNSSDESSM